MNRILSKAPLPKKLKSRFGEEADKSSQPQAVANASRATAKKSSPPEEITTNSVKDKGRSDNVEDQTVAKAKAPEPPGEETTNEDSGDDDEPVEDNSEGEVSDDDAVPPMPDPPTIRPPDPPEMRVEPRPTRGVSVALAQSIAYFRQRRQETPDNTRAYQPQSERSSGLSAGSDFVTAASKSSDQRDIDSNDDVNEEARNRDAAVASNKELSSVIKGAQRKVREFSVDLLVWCLELVEMLVIFLEKYPSLLLVGTIYLIVANTGYRMLPESNANTWFSWLRLQAPAVLEKWMGDL